MSDPDPGSGPPEETPDEASGETSGEASGEAGEAPADQPGDAHAHLRIIAPDPVPDGAEPEARAGSDLASGRQAASTPPPVPKGREPGAPRVRVFSDSDDPALMPLPAMGPGSGGSRIEAEDDDTAPRAPTTGEVGVAAAAVDASAATEGDAGPETVEAHAEEPTTVESVSPPAGESDDGTVEGPEVPVDEDATDTATMEAAAPPAEAGAEVQEPASAATGVQGVRLDRSDTGEIIKVSPDSLPRGGDGAATVAADATEAREATQDASPAGAGSPAAGPSTFSQRPSPLVKVATGIGFGLVAIAVILLGRPAFAALTGILIVWGVVEFYAALYHSVQDEEQPAAAAQSGGAAMEAHVPPVRALAQRSAAVVGVAAVAAMAATSFFFGVEATGAVAAGALVAVVLWFVPGVGGPIPPRDAALSALAIVHVGVAGSFAMLILRLEHGFALLLVVVILTVVSDVAAYGWGATVGRTPFFASVSPNKTLEGFVGAVATTIVAGFVIAGLHGWLYPSVPVVAAWGQVLLLATLVAVFATAGDLAESLFKRDLGIKDVASFLPGHGGMMDRLDGMIFALPVAYLFLRAMGLADVG